MVIFRNPFRDADKFYILLGVFFATYVFAPILSAGRDISFFGLPLMPGSLMVMLNVAILGVLQQNYGKDIARKLVMGSIWARLVIWTFTLLTLLLPTAAKVAGYEQVVQSGYRILLAGIAARYFSTILIDIPVFQRIKERYSSFAAALTVSLLIETIVGRAIFVFLAKYGADGHLLERFIAQGIVSIVFIFLLTPLVSLLNYLLFERKPQ